MIDLLEKIGLGLCALFLLLTIGLYARLKFPSPSPPEWLPKAYKVAPEDHSKASAPDDKPSPTSPKLESIAKKLLEQGSRVAAGEITEEPLKVPEPLFEHLTAQSNWLQEIKKAKSRPLPTKNGNTRIQLFDIQTGSYFEKLGFQNNDVVELINGEILTFEKDRSYEYMQKWDAAIAALRKGESVSVTVTRKNRPYHLEFRL